MATFVLTDAYVSLNTVSLGGKCKSVTLTYSAEMLDDTVMGCTTRSSMPGLKSWTLECQFLQDYTAGSVDATLWAMIGLAAFAFELRSSSGVVAPTNPKFTGSAVLESYTPLGGGVGELAATTASFKPGGGTAATLVRATS